MKVLRLDEGAEQHSPLAGGTRHEAGASAPVNWHVVEETAVVILLTCRIASCSPIDRLPKPRNMSLASSDTRASGNSSFTSSAIRSTPGPQAAKLPALSHCGQLDGICSA